MVRVDYLSGRPTQSGAALGRTTDRFPVLRTTLAEDYTISGFLQKICCALNPSKFVKTPLPSSLPPEWRVRINYLADQPDRGPHYVVRQSDFTHYAPLWRKTTAR